MTNERRKQIRKRRREKNRNKNRFIQWFKKLSKGKKASLIAGVIVLLLIIAVVIFVMSKFSKLDTQEIKKEEIHINEFEEEEVGVGYTNFVLFGGDSRKGNVESDLNTDTIIIVSLNNETKEVKMVSVYRDTLLDVSKGSVQKCNSAYARGGATQAINMLNMNLDLSIQQYVTVDFGAVSDVIDMLGGIEVDVSEAEWRAVNQYIDETAMVAGKKAKHLTHAGVQTLDGVQATTYARIRKGVGDDYARTERQRLVIQKAFEKALKANFSTLNKIIDEVFPQVSTNLAMTDILKYAKDVTKYKIVETSGFPFEKGSSKIPGRGSCVYPITLKKNVSLLHGFLYGTEDYQPSSKVVSISGAIASLVGNREVEPNTTWTDDGSSAGDGTGTEPSDGTKPEDATKPSDDKENQDGDSGSQDGDNGSQGGDNGSQGGDSGSQGGDSGSQGGDNGSQGGDNGSQGGDSGSQGGGSGSQGGDSGSQGGDSGSQGGDSGSQGGDSGSQGGDSGSQGGDGETTE